MSDTENWTYSSDEECWSEDTGFPTREAAIAAAEEHFKDEDVEVFWTGMVKPITLRDLAVAGAPNAETVIEDMEQHIYDQVGDVVANEIDTTAEQKEELEDEFASVVESWLTKHNLAPKVFQVDNTNRHEMPVDEPAQVPA